MDQGNPSAGLVAYIVGLLLIPYLVFAMVPGWIGILSTGIAVMLILGGGVVGVRRRGFAFFGYIAGVVDGLSQEDKKTSNGTNRSRRKKKRPSGYWMNQLKEAVGGQCEIQACRRTRHLEVHHIEAHANGGTNRLNNLIVVCPDHHKDCEPGGGINKTRQKAIISRRGRLRPSDFEERWAKAVLAREQPVEAETETLW